MHKNILLLSSISISLSILTGVFLPVKVQAQLLPIFASPAPSATPAATPSATTQQTSTPRGSATANGSSTPASTPIAAESPSPSPPIGGMDPTPTITGIPLATATVSSTITPLPSPTVAPSPTPTSTPISLAGVLNTDTPLGESLEIVVQDSPAVQEVLKRTYDVVEPLVRPFRGDLYQNYGLPSYQSRFIILASLLSILLGLYLLRREIKAYIRRLSLRLMRFKNAYIYPWLSYRRSQINNAATQ